MLSKVDQGRGLKERERLRRLRRAQTDLYWLATEILGYDLLTREFHGPILEEMDRRTALRLAGKYHRFEFEMWPRGYYKTTVLIARILQALLIDDALTFYWYHAVEDKASESVVEAGRLIQTCKAYRDLKPEIMPPPVSRARKWCSSKGFRMPGCEGKDKTMTAAGAGSESTGGHCDVLILDDIIGLNDIEDNQMPKKRRWFGSTAMNVVNSKTRLGGPVIWGAGTHWDIDDIYTDWRKSKDWDVRVRGCYELEDGPDWGGEAVLFSRDVIQRQRRNMSDYEFSCQKMNDPLPDTARMWHQESCEHYCSVKEASGRGRIFVLSDPAPREVGSISGVKEKERGDTSKDWWSLAVIKIQVHGQITQKILLGGLHSQDWGTTEGLEKAAELMLKWNTDLFFNESYGGLGADYSERMREICKAKGVRLRLERVGKDSRLPRFNDSHASGAKNLRFESLCDSARRGEFMICETCSPEFLMGTDAPGNQQGKVGFLNQARNWRALSRGKNTLKWDDDADVVSRATDSALQSYAPKPSTIVTPVDWSPYVAQESAEASIYSNQYISF